MSTIFISWDQPLKPGSPAFAGYELCYDPDCHPGIHGERAEISVSDLKQRECYNMTVHATNDMSGKSIPSNTVWIATGRIVTIAAIAATHIMRTHTLFILTHRRSRQLEIHRHWL